MDEDIAKWIMEYLLRQRIDEKIINGVISVLPLASTDNRLTKSILLRKIEFEISNGSITEKILDFLEIIEELDHREGKSVSESMKLAYCAVAVDITLRFLGGDMENNDKYLEMVRKVWQDRVRLVESFVSVELNRWMSEFEESVKDLEVRERILTRNTRNEVSKAVRVYLKEAWGCIGPTFLELVAEKFGNVFDGVDCHGSRSSGGCGVVEDNPCPDLVPYRGTQKGQMSQPTGRKHIATKGKHIKGAKISSTDERIEDESMNASKRCSDDERNEDELLNKSRRRRTDEGNGDEPTNKRKHRRCDEGNERGSMNILKTLPTPEPDRVQAPSSAEHNATDGLQAAQNVSTVVETNNIGNEAVVENPKKLELKELGAFVRDSLPDALHTAQTLISTIATNNVSGNKTVEVNQTTPKNDEHRENGTAGISEKIKIPVSATKKVDMKQRGPIKPSSMEPDDTSHTIERNDSIDNTPSQSPHRPRLGSPRESKPSPLKRYDGVAKISKRRARKMWTPEEEEKLRDGVEKFGKGSWKLILHCYRTIFQDRTEIDLKDKWRNLTRSR